jgi:two-component sensor histidine kinase
VRLVNALRELRQKQPWLGLLLGLSVFLFAFLLRFLSGDAMRDLPFITLLPAILIAAMIGGLRVGVVVAVLSGVAAWYWFLPPQDSFELEWPHGPLSLVFFAVTAAIELYIIRTLNLAVDQLSAERDLNTVMFQELQHRVANNLQFVSSLLSYQRREALSDPAAAVKALDVAQNRLDLMARIHRRLYEPAALHMPLGKYFEGLCQEILEATGAKNVVCVVEMPQVTFDIRRLMALSLLVNEIITNSVKHGFSEGKGGTVSLRLDEEAANRYALTIKDNGRGIAADQDTSKGLGFTIMRNLAAQLSGEISFSGEGGMRTRIVFPANA